jgi:hypothetical protein
MVITQTVLAEHNQELLDTILQGYGFDVDSGNAFKFNYVGDEIELKLRCNFLQSQQILKDCKELDGRGWGHPDEDANFVLLDLNIEQSCLEHWSDLSLRRLKALYAS